MPTRRMFSRPVDTSFPVKALYAEKHTRYEWSIDPDNGVWVPTKGSDGLGQHRGIDFDCPPATIVRAMADGVILRARFEMSLDSGVGAGLYITQLLLLPGYDSWVLRYSHLSTVFCAPGQRVQRGTPIGESGNSGAVLSPYLHVDLMDLRHQWRSIRLEMY